MPRILVLCAFLEHKQAGAGQAIIHLLNALGERHPGDVTVCTFSHEPGVLHPGVRIIDMSVPAAPRFFWRFSPLVYLRQCAHALRVSGAPRATFCYSASTQMALAYRRLHADVPLVTHTGAVLADRELREESEGSDALSAINASLVRHLEIRSYREPRWTHIVSTRLVARQREAHFGLPRDFFVVQPYGLDLGRFRQDVPREDMRLRHDIPEDAFVMVCVARLVQWKNHDMLLRAMAGCTERPWLFVVGDGPELPALRALAHTLGIAERVRFTGHADPAPYLASSDLFVLPSRIESFGLAYAEAMSMGLPCIGLRNRPPEVLSSAEDVIPEGRAGYCVENEAQLRERIDELARSPGLVREFGAFARRLATSEYTTDRYIERLESLERAMPVRAATPTLHATRA